MSALTGKKITTTYKDLLHVPNGNAGVDATMRSVFDGEGTSSALQVSTTGVKSTGTLEVATLPTSDPSNAGQLWKSGGFIMEGSTLAALNTLTDVDIVGAAAGSVLIYDATNSNWKVLPLNLQYDSTNGTVGIGGAAAPHYKHKLHGDLLVEQTGTDNGAVLTIQNNDPTNDTAVLILASQDPKIQHKDTNGSTDKKFFLTKYGDGTLTFIAQNDDGGEKTKIPLRLVENGSTILGGESSDGVIAGYKHTVYGDTIIQDGTGEATLTVQNTNAGGLAAVLRLIADNPTVVWNDDGGATDQKLMQVGFGTGSMDFTFYSDVGSPYAIPLQLTTDGTAAGVKLNGLPTTDPAVAGQLWRDGTDIKISLG